MVVAFYFRLHLAYFPRPVVAIFARPEQCRLHKDFFLDSTLEYYTRLSYNHLRFRQDTFVARLWPPFSPR